VEAVNHPKTPPWGRAGVPFSRVLYIEQETSARSRRPSIIAGPRRRGAAALSYFIKCVAWSKTSGREVIELHCTYDPATRGGDAPDGRKVKATLHWVSAAHALPAEARLYDASSCSPTPTTCRTGWISSPR